MAKLQISGQVLYNNLTPAPNAHVEIWELDLGPGGVNDKILTRTTNDQGRFSGLSSEWEDREGVAVFGVSVPDILNLEFRVSVMAGITRAHLSWATVRRSRLSFHSAHPNQFRSPSVTWFKSSIFPIHTPEASEPSTSSLKLRVRASCQRGWVSSTAISTC